MKTCPICKQSVQTQKVKIAIISPSNYLDKFSNWGNMHMCLAHLVTQPGSGLVFDQYTKYYFRHNEVTILDNGLYENKKSIPADTLLTIAKGMRIFEVVAPDVIYDGIRTIASTKSFINLVRTKKTLGRLNIMGVVQGGTKEEWLDCYKQMIEIKGVDTIGLSKLSIPVCFGSKNDKAPVTQSRLKLLDLLDRYNLWSNQHKYHLLGGDNWLGYEIKQVIKNHYPIRSNDSSVCVNYGAHGLKFNKQGKINKYIKTNLSFNAEIDSKNFKAINHNCSILTKIAGGEI